MNLSFEGYLESLGCELWPGEAFYLTDPESRVDAATWYRNLTVGYARWKADQQALSSSSSWASLHG